MDYKLKSKSEKQVCVFALDEWELLWLLSILKSQIYLQNVVIEHPTTLIEKPAQIKLQYFCQL